MRCLTTASIASSSSKRAPLVEIITGSITTHVGLCWRSAFATRRTVAALPSMPVLTAAMGKSSNTALS